MRLLVIEDEKKVASFMRKELKAKIVGLDPKTDFIPISAMIS